MRLTHPTSDCFLMRAAALIRRISLTCAFVFGMPGVLGLSSQFLSSAGCGPWQWMQRFGQECAPVAAQRFPCLSSKWLEDPHRPHLGLDAQERALCQSQHRVHCTVMRRRGRILDCVRQPNKKRVRGKRWCASGKRAIQVVSEDVGFASLSRDATMAIGATPAAAVRASCIAAAVTG